MGALADQRRMEEACQNALDEVVSIIHDCAKRGEDATPIARAHLTSTYGKEIIEIAAETVNEPWADGEIERRAKAIIRIAAKRYRRALDREAELRMRTDPNAGAFS